MASGWGIATALVRAAAAAIRGMVKRMVMVERGVGKFKRAGSCLVYERELGKLGRAGSWLCEMECVGRRVLVVSDDSVLRVVCSTYIHLL